MTGLQEAVIGIEGVKGDDDVGAAIIGRHARDGYPPRVHVSASVVVLRRHWLLFNRHQPPVLQTLLIGKGGAPCGRSNPTEKYPIHVNGNPLR
jgi:hypothetical protein